MAARLKSLIAGRVGWIALLIALANALDWCALDWCAEDRCHGATVEGAGPRRPATDSDLRAWLQNMVWYHHYSLPEIHAATGLGESEIREHLATWQIDATTRPTRDPDAPLLVLPYPGGRHPRIGFLDGAVNPQRETKVSVFAPWDPESYVVVDVPEAIWSNLGLTYLAHTHVPTIWEAQQLTLAPREWQSQAGGEWVMERKLPNGIAFGTRVVPRRDGVRMEMWLRNGTDEPLSDLRVQQCVMLKGAAGFTEQTNENKIFGDRYAAVQDPTKRRWVITGWSPIWRCWGNAKCPCLHADPRFADCLPGQTSRLHGWLSFYEGEDIEQEFRRLDALGWDKPD